METRENILQEIKELSPIIAGTSRDNVFPLPQGYFEAFPSLVLARIHAENAEFGSKAVPFTLPAGYFEGFAAGVMQRINQEQTVAQELEMLAPLLNTISREPLYKVPEGYFESLELTIPLKLDKPSARIFNFGKARRAMQYAVAACTAGILVIGAFIFTNKNSGADGMLITYDSAMKMDVAEELSETNVEDLGAYLEQTPAPGYAMNTTEEVDMMQSLETTTDEEIEEYLEEGPVTGDDIKGS